MSFEETCEDLPKYASCGYLRFRMSGFRSIIYNLLTDMQKKEFHNRAMKFLERESRRCKSCGAGIFPDILGEPKKNVGRFIDQIKFIKVPFRHGNLGNLKEDHVRM